MREDLNLTPYCTIVSSKKIKEKNNRLVSFSFMTQSGQKVNLQLELISTKVGRAKLGT